MFQKTRKAIDYPTCCFGLKWKSSRGVSVIVAERTIMRSQLLPQGWRGIWVTVIKALYSSLMNLLYYVTASEEATSTSSLCSVAEHLLCRAALLLRSGRLALVGSAWVWALTLDLLTLPLSALHHRGDLTALSCRYRPPRESRCIQLVTHGVDQSREIDEVCNRLRRCAAAGTHRFRDEFCRAVVECGRAADRVERDREDGIVQREGPVAGRQVAHSYRLQAGELGGGVAGDGCDGDVGQPHGAVGGGG